MEPMQERPEGGTTRRQVHSDCSGVGRDADPGDPIESELSSAVHAWRSRRDARALRRKLLAIIQALDDFP